MSGVSGALVADTAIRRLTYGTPEPATDGNKSVFVHRLLDFFGARLGLLLR
jgi:hypothetical protein